MRYLKINGLIQTLLDNYVNVIVENFDFKFFYRTWAEALITRRQSVTVAFRMFGAF